jgi:hypothetical protein
VTKPTPDELHRRLERAKADRIAQQEGAKVDPTEEAARAALQRAVTTGGMDAVIAIERKEDGELGIGGVPITIDAPLNAEAIGGASQEEQEFLSGEPVVIREPKGPAFRMIRFEHPVSIGGDTFDVWNAQKHAGKVAAWFADPGCVLAPIRGGKVIMGQMIIVHMEHVLEVAPASSAGIRRPPACFGPVEFTADDPRSQAMRREAEGGEPS